MLMLKTQESHELLVRARPKAKEDPTKVRYQLRAGIESTLSQGVRSLGLRCSRYIGLEKTSLQHTLTATALNFSRLVNWWDGERKQGNEKPSLPVPVLLWVSSFRPLPDFANRVLSGLSASWTERHCFGISGT